jgi:hypothetical protein
VADDEVRHGELTLASGIHIAPAWSVADAAARLGLPVTPLDVLKFCYQQDTGRLWLLTDDAPMAWVSDYEAAAALIAPLSANIATNTTDISALETALGTTQSDLDAAEAAIVSNTTNIGINATAITALQTAIAGRVKTRLITEFVNTGSTRTLAATDFPADGNKLLVINTGINYALTWPQELDAAIPLNASIAVLRYHAQTLTIVQGTGANVRPTASVTARAQYSMLVLTKLFTNECVVSGDMT